jgi:hypothetical protein
MELPNQSIGISDILGWQDCGRRMSFQMARHVKGQEPPEAHLTPTTRYGTAFHDAAEFIEKEDATEDEAIQHLMSNGHRWLQPPDIERLRGDIAVYRKREPLGVRTVWNEQEIRVPLFVYKGRQIYFRARIDRLYERINEPGVYEHRDYKTSGWPKTQEEVDDDPQMEAYAWAIREYLPEVDRLVQTYDQLQFGELQVKEKDEETLLRRKDWLIIAVTAIIEDEDYGPDGLLVPQFNRFCAWCPIMESCAVIPLLTDYAQAEIAAAAPERKEGRKTVVDLDPARFDYYLRELEKVATAKGVLERFEKTVKSRIQSLPPHQREELGFDTRSRMLDYFPPDALRAAHALLGDDFYRVATVTKAALERTVMDETQKSLIVGMADKRPGSAYVQRKGTGRRRAGRAG